MAGGRLDPPGDGLCLLAPPDPLSPLAAAAYAQANGDRATPLSANQHINPTNVCILRNTCVFCSFARMPKEDGAYTRTLEEVFRRRSRPAGCRPASSTSWAASTPSSG